LRLTSGYHIMGSMQHFLAIISCMAAMTVSTNALQCYECSTYDMTQLEYDVKSQLEALTEPRTMDGVATTSQCQDVAATPDENLVDCTGVCLSGIFNMDEDILWRTCVTATEDCADLESDPTEGTTYHCSSEDKGNNIRRIIRGVEAPALTSESDSVVEPTRNPAAPAPGSSSYDSEGWSCTDGWAIEGHNIEALQMVDIDGCKQACIDKEGCVNIELGERDTHLGTVSWCLLGDLTQTQAEHRFIENPMYIANCDKE